MDEQPRNEKEQMKKEKSLDIQALISEASKYLTTEAKQVLMALKLRGEETTLVNLCKQILAYAQRTGGRKLSKEDLSILLKYLKKKTDWNINIKRK